MKIQARQAMEFVPAFDCFVDEIQNNGITTELIYKILQRHRPNAMYNQKLFARYIGVNGGLPIYDRKPRYEEENPINNRINNDFFGEICDFKVGYFAGNPIAYGYSGTDEAEKEAGGEKKIDDINKALSDFTVRNNMYGCDMTVTKYASIYGYAGRLFYIDENGNERVMPVHGYNSIFIAKRSIAAPEYAIRYFETTDTNDTKTWVVEFYDETNVHIFKGDLQSLSLEEVKLHLFDYCPLQGVANNDECIGDAEKVLGLIDDYDKVLSDNSNELESFVHALMQIGVNVDDDVIRKAQKSGVLVIPQVGSNAVNEPVKWITKNINDAFTEHHLQRLEDNIYRFSKTPNLKDDTFNTASGIALKFKLHGLETKCSTFQSCFMNSAIRMWEILCSSWEKKGIKANPLEFTMEFSRNFPLDKLSEAQTAQAMIAAGLPKAFVYSQIAGVDDVDYILELIEEEKSDIPSLSVDIAEDNENNEDKEEKEKV